MIKRTDMGASMPNNAGWRYRGCILARTELSFIFEPPGAPRIFLQSHQDRTGHHLTGWWDEYRGGTTDCTDTPQAITPMMRNLILGSTGGEVSQFSQRTPTKPATSTPYPYLIQTPSTPIPAWRSSSHTASTRIPPPRAITSQSLETLLLRSGIAQDHDGRPSEGIGRRVFVH